MSQDKRPRENASRVGDFVEERVESVVLYGGGHKYSKEDRTSINTLFVTKVQTSTLPSEFSGWGCQCTLIVTFSIPPLFSRSPPSLTRALASRAIEARSSSSTILSIDSSTYSFGGESGRGRSPNCNLQKISRRPNLVNIHQEKLTE